MSNFQIFLFRRFKVHRDDHFNLSVEGQKVQGLLSYLLINHHRPHPREKIAGLLWPDSSETNSKQYLRQTLWQLQSVLRENIGSEEELVLVESDWIRINPVSTH